MAQKNLKLGEILINAGVIDEFQLNSALSRQRNWGGRLGNSLIKLGYVTEEILLKSLSDQLKLPRVNLTGKDIPDSVIKCIPVAKAKEYNIIPVAKKETNGVQLLLVAMTDPTNLNVIDEIQFITGCRVRAALSTEVSIQKAISKFYDKEEIDSAVDQYNSIQMITPEEDEFSGRTLDNLQKPVVKSAETMEQKIELLCKILLDKGIITLRDYERLK
ncbi:MAG: hypothetical protein P1P74_05010 [Desulfuromonadales bacterium]|nr:hypothetical protein [Desulfuromonadales bacterium]